MSLTAATCAGMGPTATADVWIAEFVSQPDERDGLLAASVRAPNQVGGHPFGLPLLIVACVLFTREHRRSVTPHAWIAVSRTVFCGALDCTRCAAHDPGMAAVSSRCWIFLASPDSNFAEGLKPGRTENWDVSSFVHEIALGDVVYLWQAGSAAALVGWATVKSPVSEPDLSESRTSPAPSPRVELLYQAKFDPPIPGTEIRSNRQLANLAVLRMPQRAIFRVEPAEARALRELVRTQGFRVPPESTEDPGTPSPIVSWDGLSSAAQDVFAWAAASESPTPLVGTRGLLIGLLRTNHSSEASQLLEYARVPHEEVFDTLQQLRTSVRINPTVQTATPLSKLPTLTPNGQQVLSGAFQLQTDHTSQVEPRHLFGAILQVEQSMASQALEKVLEGRIPVENIRGTYTDFLQSSATQSYSDFLQKLFAGERPSTSITTDTWTDCDQLEYELYADAIAQFILDPKTKAPLTIGIKAPWGAGKTSLMRMIRRHLDPNAPTKPRQAASGSRLTIWEVLRNTWARTPDQASNELSKDLETKPSAQTTQLKTIWFNAWKYQSSEQLWAGLAHAILSQVADRMSSIDRDRLWASIQVRRLRLPELRRFFYRYILLRLLPYLLVIPIASVGVFVTWLIDPGALEKAWIGGGIVGVLSLFIGMARSARDEVTKATPQLVEEPDYESRLGFLHLVDSDMHRILDLSGASAERPFVIFVDDLDRCTYNTVAQVIEALNVFLAGDFDNCIFVIAMEPDLVAAQIHIAYEKLFQRLGEDGGEDLGWRFLEKMVQLPLALPEPERPQVEHFLDSILAAGTQTRIIEFTADAPEVKKVQQSIRELNPTGSIEGISDAMEKVREQKRAEGSGGANLDALVQQAARREFRDIFSDAHARAMVMRHADELSGNPREIKRFVNVLRFYAYIEFWRKTQGFDTPGLEGAAKLARIAITWPRLLSVLAKEVPHNGGTLSLLGCLEEAGSDDSAWDACIENAPEQFRAQLANERQLRAVISRQPRVGANIAGFL
jgi:KAP family P-loop domain/EVE domain